MGVRLVALVVTALAAAGCGTAPRAHRLRPSAPAPPSAILGPSAGYLEAMALYRRLDFAGAESRLEGEGLADGEATLVRARIALARLDFEKARELLGERTDGEALQLRWRAAWFSDRLDEVATLDVWTTRDSQFFTDVAALTKLRSISTHRRIEVGSDGPRRVRIDGQGGLRFPCRIAGEEAFARIDLSRPLSLAPASLLKSDGWTQVTFKSDGHEVRIRAPFVAKGWTKEVLLGADVARALHATIEFPQPALTIDLDEPAATPITKRLQLAWPLGERPMALATLMTDRAEPVTLAFSRAWDDRLELLPRWSQPRANAGKNPRRVRGVQLGEVLFRPEVVSFTKDLYVIDRDEIDLDVVVTLPALAVRAITLGTGGRELWTR